MWFTHTFDIVRGLVGRDSNISVMEVGQVFCAIWIFTDLCFVSADLPFELFYNTHMV